VSLPLAGRTVVVTRATAQAGTLAAVLRAAGAEVVEVPSIEIAEPADGGAGLLAALGHLEPYDWLVVTSANGAVRLVEALAGRPPSPVRVAAVGPGTAAALLQGGIVADLVPERFVAEGLVDAFPAGPGSVLVAQAEAARPVLAEGLRAKGWHVEVVVAYRTLPARPGPGLVAAAAAADAITFTSGSTVTGYLAVAGAEAVPPIVACIGPVTADVARTAGLDVTVVAAEHSLEGLVSALVGALAGTDRGGR
jgi:uroporphyrinogen-III synthase